MFDYTMNHLAPGEQCDDWHHIGVLIANHYDEPGRVTLQLGGAELDIFIAPQSGIREVDEARLSVTIINTGPNPLIVEWQKSRD